MSNHAKTTTVKKVGPSDALYAKLEALEQRALNHQADNSGTHRHEPGPLWNESVRLLHAFRNRQISTESAEQEAAALEDRMGHHV